MRMFKQNKLWRDKLIEKMESEYGSRVHWRQLDDIEFNHHIRVKLLEETHELVASKDKNEIIGEMADLYEVVASLANLYDITPADIIAAQAKKREERGGFMGRRFVEVVQHPVGSFGEKYCLAQPEKYPEIIAE